MRKFRVPSELRPRVSKAANVFSMVLYKVNIKLWFNRQEMEIHFVHVLIHGLVCIVYQANAKQLHFVHNVSNLCSFKRIC